MQISKRHKIQCELLLSYKNYVNKIVLDKTEIKISNFNFCTLFIRYL